MCFIWRLILSANNQAQILIAFEEGIKDDIVLDHQKQFNLFLKAGIKVAALFTKMGKARGHSLSAVQMGEEKQFSDWAYRMLQLY